MDRGSSLKYIYMFVSLVCDKKNPDSIPGAVTVLYIVL